VFLKTQDVKTAAEQFKAVHGVLDAATLPPLMYPVPSLPVSSTNTTNASSLSRAQINAALANFVARTTTPVSIGNVDVLRKSSAPYQLTAIQSGPLDNVEKEGAVTQKVGKFTVTTKAPKQPPHSPTQRTFTSGKFTVETRRDAVEPLEQEVPEAVVAPVVSPVLEQVLAQQQEHGKLLQSILSQLQGDELKLLAEANRVLKIENEALQEENTILRRKLDTTN